MTAAQIGSLQATTEQPDPQITKQSVFETRRLAILASYMKTAGEVTDLNLTYFDNNYHLKIDESRFAKWSPDQDFFALLDLIKASIRKGYIKHFGFNEEGICFHILNRDDHRLIYPTNLNGPIMTEFIFERLIELIWNIQKDKETHGTSNQ